MSDQTPEPPPSQDGDQGSNYYRAQYVPPQTDAMGRIIPTQNMKALAGYYMGCGSVIPCLGLFLGPVAVFFGIGGLNAIKANPNLPGKAHAWIAIAAGVIGFLYNFALLLIFGIAFLTRN